MPKLTRSRPSILFRSLLMGAVVRLVLLIVPVKRGELPPGSVKVTGPCDARVNVPPSLLVWMTPLVIRKSGSVSVICLIAVENKAREPSCLNSWLVTWLVSFSPSPKGSSSTRTVNKKSAVVTLVGSGETLVKENVKLLAAVSAVRAGGGPTVVILAKSAESGPYFIRLTAGASALTVVSSVVPPKSVTPKIGRGRKSVNLSSPRIDCGKS